MTQLHRLLLLATVLCAALAAFADITADRILLLRGAISLHEGRALAAVADLREAAELRLEDWQCQMLYGQALAKAGMQAMAVGQLRRAVLQAPTRMEPWRALADCARDAGDRQLELYALTGLMRFFPDDPPLLHRLADIYTELKQPDAAARATALWESSLPPMQLDAEFTVGGRKATIQELRMVLQENPNHPSALPALATEEWKAGNHDAALLILQKVIKLRPNDPSIINSYAHACFVLGKPDEALRVLNEAAPLGDYSLDHALANWSISQGRYAEAIGPLQRMLMREPVNPNINRQLGVAAMLAGDYDTALAGFKVSWMKLPDPVTAQHYVATLFAAGKDKEADDLLNRALTLFPQETMLKLMLIQRLCATDHLLQAAQLTLDLAKARPETVQLTILAGERFLQAGFMQKATDVAGLLRDNYPADVIAIQGAIRLFRRMAALSEARNILTRYLGPNMKAPMDWTSVMLEIAKYALDSNQLTEADTALGEIFQRDVTYRPAYFAIGHLKEQQRQWNEAIRLYNQALTHWPDDTEIMLALARVAREAGNYTLALQTYARIRMHADGADAWLESGDLYHIQGDETFARECWSGALERPGGGVRARLALLISYEGAGEADKAATALEELKTFLNAERERKTQAWKSFLAAYGLAPTPEELDALLLMAPDLIDPAPLRNWRKPEPPPIEPKPATENKPAEEKPATAPANADK